MGVSRKKNRGVFPTGAPGPSSQFVVESKLLISHCYFVCIILVTLCSCWACLFSISGLCLSISNKMFLSSSICFVLSHSSLLPVALANRLGIRLKHEFMKVDPPFTVATVVLHIFKPYVNTALTPVLNNLIFVCLSRSLMFQICLYCIKLF